MKKDPRVYLAHILECAERIRDYLGKDQRAFGRNRMAQDAVIRNSEVIGEAVKRVPESFRNDHPDVP